LIFLFFATTALKKDPGVEPPAPDASFALFAPRATAVCRTPNPPHGAPDCFTADSQLSRRMKRSKD